MFIKHTVSDTSGTSTADQNTHNNVSPNVSSLDHNMLQPLIVQYHYATLFFCHYTFYALRNVNRFNSYQHFIFCEYLNIRYITTRGGVSHQGGPSRRGLLPTVAAVDAVALHQLIGRRVGPEVVRGLHLGVLQGTGSHWETTREGTSTAPPF